MRKTTLFVVLAFASFVLFSIIGCAPAATPVASPTPEIILENKPLTLAEVEKMSGLDVSEPAYLPSGVSFDFATYQATPSPSVMSQFKLVHEQYGDMGRFFQIIQESQETAPPNALSCGENTEGCNVIQVNGMPIVYRLHTTETEGVTTEGLDWYKDGFSYRLLRTAGEPNKTYQAELIKVVASMQ
jgi:hypothetical protein